MSLCDANGWCWENPLPQGNTLRGSWVQNRRSVFLVGDGATVLHFDGERFTLMPTPAAPQVTLFAVHGLGAEAWAVGSGGTILHFDGSAWRSESNSTTDSLFAVVALPVTGGVLVYAAGEDGTILKRTSSDGGAWGSQLSATGERVIALAAEPGPVVRALTAWSGEVLVSRAMPANQFQLEATLGFDGLALATRDGEWFALGESQRPDGGWRADLVRAPGAFASGQPVERLEAPFQTLAVEPGTGALYLTGHGDFGRYTADAGLAWVGAPDEHDDFFTLAVLEANHVLAAGNGGDLGVCRPPCQVGTDLRNLSRGSTRDLLGLCGRSADTLVAVSRPGCTSPGCRVRVLERRALASGTDWSTVEVSGTNPEDTVTCITPSATDTWAFAPSGVGVRRAGGTGGTWRVTPSFVGDAGMVAAWHSEKHDRIYALGRQQTVFEATLDAGFSSSVDYDGGALLTLFENDDKFLAVGVGGEAYTIQNNEPDPVSLNNSYIADGRTQRDLFGAYTSPDGGYVIISAGDNGVVASRVQGDTRLNVRDGGPAVDYTGVWVTASGWAWFSTRQGKVVRAAPSLPDSGLFVETLPTARALNDVWGVPAGDGGLSVWVVGQGGLVLRKEY